MKRTLLLDGAMGTELQNRGIDIPLPLWSADANIKHPEVVINIHKDYINSGADIITTNTFRTTAWTYRKAGFSNTKSEELSRSSLYKAVECAQIAVSNSVKIAGSITTIEDCYLPELFPGTSAAEDTYGQTIEWLVDAGVDFILFETMGNIEEISCALEMSRSYNIPIWLSLISKDKYNLLDGSPFEKVFELFKSFSIDHLLINCNTIDLTIDMCDQIHSAWSQKWGVYPNLGKTNYENDYLNIISDSNLNDGMISLLSKEPNVIGLCCGSTPFHIKYLKSLIKSTR